MKVERSGFMYLILSMAGLSPEEVTDCFLQGEIRKFHIDPIL